MIKIKFCTVTRITRLQVWWYICNIILFKFQGCDHNKKCNMLSFYTDGSVLTNLALHTISFIVLKQTGANGMRSKCLFINGKHQTEFICYIT